MRIALVVLAAALTPLWPQEFKVPLNLKNLSAKAENSVDVTLDAPLLRLTGKLLSEKDGDEANVKKLIGGLDGIYVRSYEFAHENDYNRTDLNAVRNQLRAPAWLRIVGVRSKQSGEEVEVYIKNAEGGALGAIVVIAAEPRALTIGNVAGQIDLAQLSALGGQFHIPKFDFSACTPCRGEI